MLINPTLDKLAPGAHKVRFTLQNSDHSDIAVEKTVNFTVSASAPSSHPLPAMSRPRGWGELILSHCLPPPP